jgi:hypothetical protein
LIFLRESTLMAQALDLSRLELRGEAVPVAEKTQIFKESVSDVTGAFTVSETGVLAIKRVSVWFGPSSSGSTAQASKSPCLETGLTMPMSRCRPIMLGRR